MDFKNINSVDAANNGAFMQITHPVTNVPMCEKDGTKVGINLLGLDSDKFRQIKHKATNRTLNKKRNQVRTAEQIEEDSVRNIAALATGWQGIDNKGKPREFSIDEVVALLTEEPWIREQCEEFVSDRANFLMTG